PDSLVRVVQPHRPAVPGPHAHRLPREWENRKKGPGRGESAKFWTVPNLRIFSGSSRAASLVFRDKDIYIFLLAPMCCAHGIITMFCLAHSRPPLAPPITPSCRTEQ